MLTKLAFDVELLTPAYIGGATPRRLDEHMPLRPSCASAKSRRGRSDPRPAPPSSRASWAALAPVRSRAQRYPGSASKIPGTSERTTSRPW